MSWPELEYSYGLHLKHIITKAGFAECDNQTGYIDSDVASLIIEIGRFFNEIGRFFKETDPSNQAGKFPSETVPGAIDSSVDSLWPEEIRKNYLFDELHRRCHMKGLLKDWQKHKILRVQFNGVLGSGRSDRSSELLYILETILCIVQGECRTRRLLVNLSQKECNKFIVDFLKQHLPRRPQRKFEQADGQVFKAAELNLGTLKTLGGLRIIWSDSIDDHLYLSPEERTIKLFWDVSLLDQSPIFRAYAECFQGHFSESSKIQILYELKTTYRLLFHERNARHFTSTETCAIKNTNKGYDIMIHDLRVDIDSSRSRKILKNLLQAPIPEKLKQNSPRNPVVRPYIGRLWWPLGRTIKAFQNLYRHKRNTETISGLIASGPPYPLDLCWHLENILLPYPLFLGESSNIRAFSNFPHFGSRLRELKFYMDNQRPSGWYQIWKDRRDPIQYVTLWAVLVFGIASIVIALGSLVVSSMQTVAAFRALKDGQH
ncbi:MAG: hypothetical protein Q9167_005860 [Letrouitia subvulpina]